VETSEKIDTINSQLKNEFGVDTVSGIPIYRVVWSDDQFEKRMSKYTTNGIELLHPQLIEMPKYRQWIKHKYILERLSFVEVDTGENNQMTVNKLSYEPIWTFQDKDGGYLPPRWDICKLIIDTVHAAIYSNHNLVKYKDPGENIEQRKAEIVQIQQELFGNETDTGDALAYKEGVVVPHNYEKVVH